MYKYIIGLSLAFFLSACSQFAVNGMMCDQIRKDPFSTIPSECRNYNEEMAQRASRLPGKILSPNDMISFEKK